MAERVRVPGEWGRHRACWMAYPYLEDEWAGRLAQAREEFCQLVAAITQEGREPVRLLVRDSDVENDARTRLVGVADVEFIRAEYGDCWTRDTLPILGVGERSGRLAGVRFGFNGWGGRYDMAGDRLVGPWFADRFLPNTRTSSLVLEGGALEFNGAGVCITTESCALNTNRNAGVDRDEIERELAELFDVERVIWLTRGLDHDHTDGHVDMVARFVSETDVVCMRAEHSDPMQAILDTVHGELERTGLRVHSIPAPGRVAAPSPLPANYCNFYIANEAVIVPTFDAAHDAAAVDAIAALFPSRSTIGLPAIHLLSQGGAFHCVTQPEPEPTPLDDTP